MGFGRLFGIDLGTNTVKIYNQKKNIITSEKNMIAIRNKTDVFATGNDAYELFERTPQNIQTITPMLNGRISDVDLVEAILHILLSRCNTFLGYRPTLFFSVPTEMTEIERRAYFSIAHRGKLRHGRIFLVEKPIADALALGIPIGKTKGSMIVNMGAQSTELAIIANQRIIISKTIPIGGDQFDYAIIAAVRRLNNFIISKKTAEELKKNLVDFSGGSQERMKISGVDVTTGLPLNGIVNSYSVTVTLQEQLSLIAEEMRYFLKRIPPQIRDAIEEEGIHLVGGSTRIKGIDSYLGQYLSCKILCSKEAEMCTILGLKELIDHPVLHRWAFSLKNESNRRRKRV